MEIILVERIARCYDVFGRLGIEERRYHEQKPEPAEHLPEEVRHLDPTYDYRRIAYFVERFQRGDDIDPICVDMDWIGGSCSGVVVTDGHHRLCAAIIANRPTISASCAGIVDIIHWLMGLHDNAPEF